MVIYSVLESVRQLRKGGGSLSRWLHGEVPAVPEDQVQLSRTHIKQRKQLKPGCNTSTSKGRQLTKTGESPANPAANPTYSVEPEAPSNKVKARTKVFANLQMHAAAHTCPRSCTQTCTHRLEKKCNYDSILAQRSAYLVEEVDPLAEREKGKVVI